MSTSPEAPTLPTPVWVQHCGSHIATLLAIDDNDNGPTAFIQWGTNGQKDTVPLSWVQYANNLPKLRVRKIFSTPDRQGGSIDTVHPYDSSYLDSKPAAKKARTNVTPSPGMDQDPLVDTDEEGSTTKPTGHKDSGSESQGNEKSDDDNLFADEENEDDVNLVRDQDDHDDNLFGEDDDNLFGNEDSEDNDSLSTPESPRVRVGTRIKKFFPASKNNGRAGWYEGTVVNIDHDRQGYIHFHISYDDGDREICRNLDTAQFLSGDGNDVRFVTYSGEPRTFSKPQTFPKGLRLVEVPSNVCRSEAVIQIVHTESAREQYFLKWLFPKPKQLRIESVTIDAHVGKLDKVKTVGDVSYELLITKMSKNEGRSLIYAAHERKMAKAYYVATEGLRRHSLRRELERLGSFSALEPGKIAARLELMLSPTAWEPNNKFPLQFEFRASDFEMIDENFNDGCGFAPSTFFEKHLGSSTKARTTCAVQVRIFGAKIGWYKGMLMKKPGIDRIQLPPSMRKVEKSALKPSPDWIVLVVVQLFPSEQCRMMDRYLNPFQRDPPVKWGERNLQCLDVKPSLPNLLRLNGVPAELLEMYSKASTEWHSRKHISLVGTADPTGELPKGSVFMTGFGTVPDCPSQDIQTFKLLVTRYPCTERDDLVCLDSILSMPFKMASDKWNFLKSLPFGILVFGTPSTGEESIPSRIADGDLDGDLYSCIWDEEIVSCVRRARESNASASASTYDMDQSDPLLHVTFQLKDSNGKLHPAYVSKKLQASLFEVEWQGTKITMKREEILDGRGFVDSISSHRGSGANTQVLVKWSINDRPVWEHVSRLRMEVANQLVDYALAHCLEDTRGWKWAKQYASQSEMTKIVNHRGKGKRAEVHVLYDDGEPLWKQMCDVKDDAPELLAYYCEERNLEDEEDWKWVSKYRKALKKKWFERVQDHVANVRLLHDYDRLTTVLHTEYKNCLNSGDDMESMIAFGRAFKQSIDIRKHGGKVLLPIHCHPKIKEGNLKNYLSVQ